MKHFVIVGILVAIGTVLMSLLLTSLHILPAGASTQATMFDWLLGLQVYVIAFLFSLIVVFVLYSVVVFRRRPGDESDGAHITDNSRLEIIWTAVPLVTVIFFATLGGVELVRTTKAQPNEMVVHVIAQQWSWMFEYPADGIQSAELVLPVNQAVLFEMTAKDVIHSFWVPEFRFKQDAVPGRTTTLRITTDRTGEFKVRCAEMCGFGHAYMIAPVRVISQSDFQTWLAQQKAAAVATPSAGGGPAAKGQTLANQLGCLGCHSTDGSVKVGPSWKGLYGRQVTLSNGQTVTADDAYIQESIVSPSAQVVQGFPDVMPHTFANLSQDDINALIAYIKTLK